VYRPSLSPKQLWIVIPYNRDEAIPVVPVSWTFDYNQPIHLYSFIHCYGNWLFTVYVWISLSLRRSFRGFLIMLVRSSVDISCREDLI
jgi:hypothetical protein